MAGNQNQSPDYLAENHDGVFTSVAAIFSIASLLTVLARLASKRLKNLWLQIDDWLLIIAWVGNASTVTLVWAQPEIPMLIRAAGSSGS